MQWNRYGARTQLGGDWRVCSHRGSSYIGVAFEFGRKLMYFHGYGIDKAEEDGCAE